MTDKAPETFDSEVQELKPEMSIAEIKKAEKAARKAQIKAKKEARAIKKAAKKEAEKDKPKEPKKGKPSKYGGNNVKNTLKYSKEGREILKAAQQKNYRDDNPCGDTRFKTVPKEFNIERRVNKDSPINPTNPIKSGGFARYVRIPEQDFLDLCLDIRSEILDNLSGLRKSFYENKILALEAQLKKSV